MNKKILLPIFILLAIVVGCKTKNKETEETVKYTATSPLQVDTLLNKNYVAQIQSVRNIEIRAQEKGYLQSINVDEGRYVHAGQVLFRIMPNMYQAEKLKALAAVKEAQVELMNTKTLVSKDIVSKSEQALKQAKLDEVKAELALAEFHLSQTAIRAPFSGITDRIPLKLGSLIEEGALLTTLSDNNNVYAYFNISETEYLNYKAAAANQSQNTVSLILANGQQHKYKGVIETVEGQFDNETGNIALRAKFPNSEMLLKHGETGKVQMTVPAKNALLIPQKATYELQDKIFVFVIDKNNTVQSRAITISGSLPDLFIVQSGLLATDKILLEGLQKVKEGDKISFEFEKPEEVLTHLRLKVE